MKRICWLAVIVSLVLPVAFFSVSCSGEKTDDDWVKELNNKRTRDNALLYIQENRNNKALASKAIPVLRDLLIKRYSTLKAIHTLGVLGDPVVVPDLLKALEDFAKKDNIDNDRATEAVALALGRIGSPQAVDKLNWAAKEAGDMGRAGAAQALGMIGDPRGTPALIELVKNSKEALLIRHYATISLGQIKAKDAADVLVFSLFVDDETGRNLFRDGQLSLIQIGGPEARDALIKGYEFKNELVTEVGKTIDLKPMWIQVKTVNVMGEMRDPIYADFFMTEIEKAFKNEMGFEVEAKMIQALARTPLQEKHLDRLSEIFLNKPAGSEFLSEREELRHVLVANNYVKKLDAFMKVAEAGDITIPHEDTPTTFANYCLASADLVSKIAGADMADRFDAFVNSNKCKTKIPGEVRETSAILADYNERMKLSKECGADLGCYEKVLKNANVKTQPWARVEKAIYVLTASGQQKYMDAVMNALDYPNDSVRWASVLASFKLAGKEHLPRLIRFWQDQKIAKEFQKATEDLGYVLYIKFRQFGVDSPKAIRGLFDEADQIAGKKADVSGERKTDELSTDKGL